MLVKITLYPDCIWNYHLKSQVIYPPRCLNMIVTYCVYYFYLIMHHFLYLTFLCKLCPIMEICNIPSMILTIMMSLSILHICYHYFISSPLKRNSMKAKVFLHKVFSLYSFHHQEHYEIIFYKVHLLFLPLYHNCSL